MRVLLVDTRSQFVSLGLEIRQAHQALAIGTISVDIQKSAPGGVPQKHQRVILFGPLQLLGCGSPEVGTREQLIDGERFGLRRRQNAHE